jgi:hypothetical protein
MLQKKQQRLFLGHVPRLNGAAPLAIACQRFVADRQQ